MKPDLGLESSKGVIEYQVLRKLDGMRREDRTRMDGNPEGRLVDSKQLSGPDSRRLDSWRLDSTRPEWRPRSGGLDGRALYWSLQRRSMDTGLGWWLVVRRTGCMRLKTHVGMLQRLHSEDVGSTRRCDCVGRSLGHATKVDCSAMGRSGGGSRGLWNPYPAG